MLSRLSIGVSEVQDQEGICNRDIDPVLRSVAFLSEIGGRDLVGSMPGFEGRD